MNFLLSVLGMIVAIILITPSIFLCLYLLKKPSRRMGSTLERNIQMGVVVTAYKNLDLAILAAKSVVDIENESPEVIILADGEDTIEEMITENFKIIYPDEGLDLKIKSIQYAVPYFTKSVSHIIVLDADNEVHPCFFLEIKESLRQGAAIVQGQRVGTNPTTHVARIAAIGEYYKNFVERKALYRLGSSATIAGSGFCIERKLYERLLSSEYLNARIPDGRAMMQEDKILQNYLINNGIKIYYNPNAIIYDRKINFADQIAPQRGRWTFSYFQNIPHSFIHLLRGIIHFDINRMLFGWNGLLLPIFLQGILCILLLPILLLKKLVVGYILGISLLIFIMSFFVILHVSNLPITYYKSLLFSPVFLFRQLVGLFQMRSPRKYFAPTKHS